MKADEVVIGGEYVCKVSGKLTTVRIVSRFYRMYSGEPHGWWAQNLETGRAVRIKTARRLRARAPAGGDK